MAETRTVTKALGGVEDLAYGKGTVRQARAGGVYDITKNRVARPVDSLAELNELDPEQFPEAVDTSTGALLVYDGNSYVGKTNLSLSSIEEVLSFQFVAQFEGKTIYLEERNDYFKIVNISNARTAANGLDVLSSFNDSYVVQLKLDNAVINVKSLGYSETNANNSNIITRADYLASTLFAREVVFPNLEANAICVETIEKSDSTVWRGLGPNSFNDGLPSGLEFTNNGIGVLVKPTTSTTYYGSAGFYNLGFTNSESNLLAIGISYDTSDVSGAAREQRFADIKIAKFVQGNIKIVGGGTHYFDRVFSFRSEKSLWLSNTSDSWFYASHFGSGKNFSNPNSVTTYGVYAVGSNGCDNLTFTACRFQECIEGIGFRGERLHRSNFTDCFWDGNDVGGMDLGDFDTVTITGGRMFRNGKTSAKGYGLLLFSTSGNEASGLSINGKLFSQDFGGIDERQDKGISFINNGNGLSNIQLVSLDTEKLTTPLANLNNADEVEIIACSKKTLPKFQTLGDASLSWNYGYNGYHVRQNVTLTADRDLTLNVGASPTGFTVKVIRTSGGAFNFNVRTGTSTLLKALGQNEWAEFSYNGTAYELIQSGSL